MLINYVVCLFLFLWERTQIMEVLCCLKLDLMIALMAVLSCNLFWTRRLLFTSFTLIFPYNV